MLGGVTGIFEMPNTQPLTLNTKDFQAKLDMARGRAWCHYAFYIGGSAANVEQLRQLEMLPGCAGIKVFMGSSFGNLLTHDDDVLERILRKGRRRLAVHAEDEMPGCASARSWWKPARIHACIRSGAMSRVP